MADNTKIGPIFRGANGGLSDDLFTGIRNSFYFSNDMEIRQDAKSIYPMGVPAYADTDTHNSNSITVGDGGNYEKDVINVTYGSNDGGWLVCSKKSVYKINNYNKTATKLCTFSTEICDLEVFNGYIYITTRQYVYYKKDDGYNWDILAAQTNEDEPNYGRCNQTLYNNGNHPLYATNDFLCVGDTHKMRKVTKETPQTLVAGFTIQTEYYIRFINEMGGFIRVTAVDEPYGSEVLLWDGVSSAIDERIPLEGYSILGSTIYNGYHYLLSNKGLGLLNGYQYYILKRAEGDVNTDVRNCMCVYDDKLYFVANNGVYIYGAKNKNYNDVLGLWHKVEDGFKLGAIGAYKGGVMVSRNGKFISGGTNEPIKVGQNVGLATTGEIQTMAYFGTSMSEIKQAAYLRVGYHLPKEGDISGDIHIYYRTEADAVNDDMDSWQRHPVQPKNEGLNATSDMRSPFATTLKLNCRFQWIQFKFVLTNCVYEETVGGDTFTRTKDTNLYSADLYYNVMLD